MAVLLTPYGSTKIIIKKIIEKNDFFRVTQCYLIRRVAFSERNGFLFVCFISVLTNSVWIPFCLLRWQFSLFHLLQFPFDHFRLFLSILVFVVLTRRVFVHVSRKFEKAAACKIQQKRFDIVFRGSFILLRIERTAVFASRKKVPGRSYLKEKKPFECRSSK